MKIKSPQTLPPILPDIKQQLLEYIICPERLPIHQYENNQEFWSTEKDICSFEIERAPLGTTLMVQRDLNTGKIIEFQEVPITGAGANAKNSMSLNRAPAPATDSIRGDASKFPFLPGGLTALEIEMPIEDISSDITDLLTTPPGFMKGLIFDSDRCTIVSEEDDQVPVSKISREDNEDNKVNLMELVQKEQDLLGLWNETKITPSLDALVLPKFEIDESDVLPSEQEIPVLKISSVKKDADIPVLKINEYRRAQITKWAVMVDVEKAIDDFHEKIPELAYEFGFELDNFQKQAILKLEENCDVFVAAHTSAGKTVVAEYAIALSQKHKTRTIYTSPIKALSNQKYRNFKHTFQDVGLVTGDFQINQTGVCLIMTTEILRSMLYGGSEIIRDLEYVIFDEVHYINDAERGHVWEEVLILLPAHVRIVLLSATVPNTMEFASWLGQTKQRKIYVVTTSKRPVPLQHFLYTGCGGKSKDERFLVLDDTEHFYLDKHKEATTALNARVKTNKNKYVTKDFLKQEAGAWGGLVDHLKRKELLPAVVFTFSRENCDKTAEILNFLNLTSEEEKFKIRNFYQRCIKRLKEPDRKLPQITKMENILKSGIGVHHSGVLPIVKEIIEMLFQKGLVKILFATETFAMGVNMPAKTVIFNGISKFDGIESRILRPEEYIQMAGRAGRRGLDKTGSVIIRCTKQVPDILVLKSMMLGKPQRLKSQFRLTYGMLLSLLRVESLSIESMMTHSFHEVSHITKADKLKVELKQAEEELVAESTKEISDHLYNLCKYYEVASEYIKQWNRVQPKLMQQPKVVKDMVPGRILLINHKQHINKFALLLIVNDKKEPLYKVLVLADKKEVSDDIELTLRNTRNENEKKETESKNKEEFPDDWYKMLSFASEEVFQPNGVGGHEVLEILPKDITKICTKIIKIDTSLVIKDWEKRQIPRFRNDPPGQTCCQAIQEVTKITNSTLSEGFYFTIADFHVKNIDLVQEIEYLQTKKKDLDSHIAHTKIANFAEQFSFIYKRKYLEEKVENLRFLISYRSLTLYPEYLSRIDVLRQLRYIDDQNRVDLKGRIACIMGMNELLVTELVFQNTLTNLEACEVAALLSALVFQAKSNVEPELTETLKKGKKEIEKINNEIERIERQCHVTADRKQSNLNFNLVQVVYEWARQKPFAEIMELTDVQEGIIVRCIQQLNEILKDVKEAATGIGDPVLQQKMDEASNAIKRDIVFAASLYTERETVNVGV